MRSRRRQPGGWRLYVILDRGIVPDTAALLRAARGAVAGGASAVQLRDKAGSVREMTRTARRLKEITSRRGVPLIVNDRIEVALAAGADGVHVGQGDIGVGLARKLLGSGGIIGVSAWTARQLRAARREGADYAGVGPVYPTPLKRKKRSLTQAMLDRVKAAGIPAVLIGGIDAAGAATLAAQGFKAIAVARAVTASRRPRRAAERLRKIMEP